RDHARGRTHRVGPAAGAPPGCGPGVAARRPRARRVHARPGAALGVRDGAAHRSRLRRVPPPPRLERPRRAPGALRPAVAPARRGAGALGGGGDRAALATAGACVRSRRRRAGRVSDEPRAGRAVHLPGVLTSMTRPSFLTDPLLDVAARGPAHTALVFVAE